VTFGGSSARTDFIDGNQRATGYDQQCMVARRAVIRWSLAAAMGGVLPAGAALMSVRRARSDGSGGNGVPTGAGRLDDGGLFVAPLRVPKVLRPAATRDGVDRYEIRQIPARQRMLPEVDTPIWGYDGVFPGPTIEARRGRRVVVTHRNELPVPTVVHLHGGVTPAESDGYPVDVVLPLGETADPATADRARAGVAGLARGNRAYVYPNDQPAATLWYHDHRMGFTGPQVYRGLAGFYLLRDDIEDQLPLPRGNRDLPLMIVDRIFAEDGSLFYPARDPSLREPGVVRAYHHSGVLGDTILVNGVAWPFHEVDAALYRLRLLNASNARQYRLRLDPPGGLIQIGSDVGLLPRPVRHDELLITPGERYDVLVDFAAYPVGTRVVLRNTLEQGRLGQVMRFEVARRVRDEARVPDLLVPPHQGPAQPSTGRHQDRRFAFFIGPAGTLLPPMINQLPFDLTRVDARPTLGSTEIWDITADPTHPVHLHMAHFRVISRNSRRPAAQDAGWKDTVFVPSGGVRVEVSFTGYRGRYLLHCHNLEHGDAGMMTNVEVV
jgi:spore coat protein A